MQISEKNRTFDPQNHSQTIHMLKLITLVVAIATCFNTFSTNNAHWINDASTIKDARETINVSTINGVGIMNDAGMTNDTPMMSDARMMRQPDINGNLIAFVYAGDIWTVSSNGGN